MSIRKILLSLTSILALFVVGQSSYSFYEAWHQKEVFEFSKESSKTIALLLSTAGDWAVERGVTHSGITSSAIPDAAMQDTIMTRRQRGNDAYMQAMEQVQSYTFSGKEALLSNIHTAYDRVVRLRAMVDQDILLPRRERREKLLESWVPAMSKLIVSTQDLRFALTQKAASLNPEIGRQSQLKHFAWIVSEYAGRERAIIGGIVSSGNIVNSQKLALLSRFRGKVDMGWNLVKKLAIGSNDDVAKSIDQSGEVFFTSFQSLRQSIYADFYARNVPSVTVTEWIKQSTKAIDTILAIQAASVAETADYIDVVLSRIYRSLWINGTIFVASLIVVMNAFYMVIFRVTRPIEAIIHAMDLLSSGDTSVVIPKIQRDDEIGRITASTHIFKENALERHKLHQHQQTLEQQAKQEKRQAMNQLADSFEERVQGIIQTVSTAAAQLSQTSQHMTSLMTNMTDTIQHTSSDATQTSSNVQSVAAASEEMSATVNEISSHVHQSYTHVKHAVHTVEQADSHAQALLASSDKVHEVVRLISDIAGQINLLALNATIESARAGEAGKGFAVVAEEVKNLAGQTDKSIQEIEKVIREMNTASNDIVASLKDIKSSVNEISESSGSVASAIEEQSATTNEIASNMQFASQGTQNISANLSHITQDSTKSQSASQQVLSASQNLLKQAETLNHEVHTFLEEIRQS